ncbi:hypothetical protein PENSPDRAFT_59599 [Peniophora sp. CONT]|nr:hypothetical protein PENSPDRAFT_59599 [Peniophora sp. CONT]
MSRRLSRQCALSPHPSPSEPTIDPEPPEPATDPLPPDSTAGPSSSVSSTNHPARSKAPSTIQEDELTDLWDEALCEYRTVTGTDLTDENSDLHRRLKACTDYRTIVAALDKIAQELDEYRNSSDNVSSKIRKALRPIVRAVLRSGVLDIAGEAVASKSIIGGKAIFVAIGVLLKATEGVSARFNAVEVLLRKFKFYVARLGVRATGSALTPESRALVVEILVDMLSTFAIATKMIRQKRLEHFFNVLIGKGDDISDLTRHTGELIEEETRLTLAEVHCAIGDLTTNLREALLKTDNDIQSLAAGVSRISSIAQTSQEGIMNMSAVLVQVVEHTSQMRSTMDFISHSLMELPGRIRVKVSKRYASESTIETGATGTMKAEGIALSTVDSFVATVSMPCSDLVSFFAMTGDLVGYLQKLSPDEQASVRRGVAFLYITASTTIMGGSPDNAIEVAIASLISPGAVLVAFLPMVLAFVAVFLFWKNVVSTHQRALPRGPDVETIFLVDVLGATFVLPLDMCSSWKDLHGFLLRQFSDQAVRDVVKYVRSRAYRVTDVGSDGNASVIEPLNWERTVRAGMTVEMSIVIRQRSRIPVCPWCRNRAPEIPYGTWINCAFCSGRYWASRSDSDTSAHDRFALPDAGLDSVDPSAKHTQPSLDSAASHPEPIVDTTLSNSFPARRSMPSASDEVDKLVANPVIPGDNQPGGSEHPDIGKFKRITVVHIFHEDDQFLDLSEGVLPEGEVASAETSLQSHSLTLRLLHEYVWLGHNDSRQHEETSKLSAHVNAAVSAAIDRMALSQAVKWLEAGISLVWSRKLALQNPLDDLEIHHPELSLRLRVIQQQLQQSGHISRLLESVNVRETDSLPPRAVLDGHHEPSVQYDRILSEIRSCAGFEAFLRPKPLSAMLPFSELSNGYIVFINVDRTRCDALVLTPSGGITPVALPDLSQDRATRLRSLWIRGLCNEDVRERAAVAWSDIHDDSGSPARLLELMWKWIVHPILLSMGITDTTDTNSLPHITWCPTGPLAQLPLHAAGDYSDPDGPRIYNHVVSSYTPSLSALLRSSEGLPKQQLTPRVLVVAQPATPGQPRLPGTVDEGYRLQKILDESQIIYTILDDKQATVSTVRSVMDQYSWVHLACHGSQHIGDATQSAFHLYDGPLSLSDLKQTAADDAELAFLSACQTAIGNENNPEESVHLAAGMLAVGFKGVVASMWSIRDRDAPIVVEAYYKKLLELRGSGAVGKGQTGAAYALHEAVKVLRDHVGELDIISWAPFVHFGA